MKYLLFIPILFFIVFAGCSSSIDTTNMSAQDRLAYAIKLYNDEDYLEAVNELQAILLQYPGSTISDDAQYYLAKTRFAREEYIMAAFEFSKLIKNMPASPFVPESQFMLAECYFQLSPNFNLDQKYTTKAISEFQAFIDFFPTNEKVPEAEKKINELNEKLAKKTYTIAQIYEKLDYYKAAIIYFDDVIDTYHDTPYAKMALYDKIKALVDRDENNQAVAEIDKYIEKYPDDQNVNELKNLKTKLENQLSSSR